MLVSVVLVVCSYSWVSENFGVFCICAASSRKIALEFALMQMFRLYFVCWVPCSMWVCGSVDIILTWLICKLRARHGVCFQSGSMRNVAHWLDYLRV